MNTSPYSAWILGQVVSGALVGVASGASAAIDRNAYVNLTLYVQLIGNASAGTLVIEEAAWDARTQSPYEGAWDAIQTVDLAAQAADSQIAVQVSGAVKFIRARVSVAVVDATVGVMAVGA